MFSLTQVIAYSYIGVLCGLPVGFMLGSVFERRRAYRQSVARAASLAARDRADPEAVPRPPAEVERAINDRLRRNGGSGVLDRSL